MKKIIILNTSQFGTLTDTYKWCEYLRDKYDVTFVCFDNHLKRMDIDGINYIYVHRFENSALRGLWYLLFSLVYCLFNIAPIFIIYFEHCDLFPRLMPWKKFHVDIRTLAVTDNEGLNKAKDEKLKKSLKYFKSISFISKGVKQKVSLNIKNQYILPLGSDIISEKLKDWTSIRLLYVGTLTHREILKTVQGLKMYIDESKKNLISYDIIGDGADLNLIADYISQNGLSGTVRLHGRIAYDGLKPYFEKCNVGVSFIPIEDCYQYQPPTKTFEYILSGMYCIATKTIANKEVVSSANGILIEDTPKDFCESLNLIEQKIKLLDSRNIRQTLVDEYTWRAIVSKYLFPIIENL